MLAAALPFTAKTFGRAIIMPNLERPVATSDQASAYRDRIRRIVPEDCSFDPLMTCFLTNETEPDDVAQGFAEGVLTAVKMYPARSTTNSAAGVTDVRRVHPLFERMQKIGMPLLIHGEVTDGDIDIFDREKVFIDRVLIPLQSDFPGLKIVLEHITTSDAVQFIREAGDTIGATITVHHLMINRNAMFDGGIRPHRYCAPIAKREHHRLALREAATSGDTHFFLGTDSAPHRVKDKESSCGCAGIFTAPVALELYAQVFDEEQAMVKLEGFASLHGPLFYGLAANTETVTLVRSASQPSRTLAIDDDDHVHVFCPEEGLHWRRKCQ
jgi:dihydroorotase